MYLENLVRDAADPQRLGRFWEGMVGGEALTDSPDIYETRLTVQGGPELDLCFQPVADPVRRSPRLHVDLLGGSEQARVVEHALALGASRLDIGQGDVPWSVLADPEGNPFCVMESRRAYADTGPIAALPLDSVNPEGDGAFWQWLTGWDETHGEAPTTLRHPSRRGLLLELLPERRAKGLAKNPLHLDLRLEASDNPDGVAEGILARGGQQMHPEWESEVPWSMYTDPSGNEFCVLPARA